MLIQFGETNHFELSGRVVGQSEIRLAERDADFAAPNVSGSTADVRSENHFATCLIVRPSSSRDVRWTVPSIAKCRPGRSGTRRVVAAEDDSSTWQGPGDDMLTFLTFNEKFDINCFRHVYMIPPNAVFSYFILWVYVDNLKFHFYV
jgi:hypothetical protein